MADYQDIPFAEAVGALGLDKTFAARTTLWPYEPADQAIARMEADARLLKVMDRANPAWRDNERRRRQRGWVVRHYAKGGSVAGTLDLDGGLGRDDIAGIVADGDLTVAGPVVNWEDTTVPFLVVRGNLACDHMMIAGTDVIVSGDVTASGLVVVTDGDAWLDISGGVTARLFVMDSDGWARVGGPIAAKGWSRSLNADLKLRKSDWPKEIKPAFREEFLDEDGYPLDHPALYQALIDGRDILRGR